MRLNCMIVDDDSMSRLLVKNFIEKTDFLTLTHELDSAIEASNILMTEKTSEVDLVFLDIEIPEMSGMELARSLKNTYPIIFITSNKDYALEAFDFEDNILDYLVKPFEYGRFLKAAMKARDQRERDLLIAEKENHIFVKSDSKLVRIQFTDLNFIEALADYVIFNTVKGKYIVHSTMKGIEKRLPISIFSRVHRSFIINRNKINHIEDFNISLVDKQIPVGASYKDQFLANINQL